MARPEKLTKEIVAIEAMKYMTRGEFYKGSTSHYEKARESKWLDDICTHMHNGNIKWTLPKLQAEALKYTQRSAFNKGSAGAYITAWKQGLLDTICSHMHTPAPESYYPFNLKGIYLLYLDTKIVYVGKSNSCMARRTHHHQHTGKLFDTVEFYEVTNAPDIDVLEIYLINKYTPIYNIESNSSGKLTLHIDNINSVVVSKTTYVNPKFNKD